jgi:hypothetical protein
MSSYQIRKRVNGFLLHSVKSKKTMNRKYMPYYYDEVIEVSLWNFNL